MLHKHAMTLSLCVCVAAAGVLPASAGTDAAPSPAASATSDDSTSKEGASLFNQYCSHCHGPWAEQGERPRDLRRLRIRYGDDAREMFSTTVTNGRLEKGMPVWKGVLSDDVLTKIYAFLETVQVDD